MKFTIANAAGGDCREFTWAGSLSLRALRHAAGPCTAGGCQPVFGGEAAQQAQAEYGDIYEQYLAGECSEEVEAIFRA
jgi:hypothetical protein